MVKSCGHKRHTEDIKLLLDDIEQNGLLAIKLQPGQQHKSRHKHKANITP